MIGLGALAGVAVVALGLVLTPGPNMIYLVLAAAGVAAVLTLVPALYLAVRVATAPAR